MKVPPTYQVDAMSVHEERMAVMHDIPAHNRPRLDTQHVDSTEV